MFVGLVRAALRGNGVDVEAPVSIELCRVDSPGTFGPATTQA
jgi:hypothetical protein